MLKRLFTIIFIFIWIPIYLAPVLALILFGAISAIFVPIVYVITGKGLNAFIPFVWVLERLLVFDSIVTKWIYKNFPFMLK